MRRELLLGMLMAAMSACTSSINETQMIHAPPREANCALQLIEVDITSYTFNQTWQVLGYVTLADAGVQDPMAEENRAKVRGRACAMGGTAVAVAINSATTARMGQSASGVTYMVLRPKPEAPAAPAAF